MMDRGELVDQVLGLVRPVVLNSSRVVESRVREEGWTVGMRAVALELSRRGPETVPVIGAAMDLPRQAVQRHADELIARGHAVSTTNPRHRRSVLIDLTEPGERALARVRDAERAAMSTLAPDCSEAELRTALTVLASLDRDIRAQARSGTRREQG
ncbi:MarR family winged helix-turn-helix transcriptional regulator [Brachybacterium sp. AOP35-5H-19]|uniref:MarR family winged helix-turn-helix transcriptional regulator n=1 Tax=Brachybacterium sp. AOP35-5H-19 TaxID=3457685 RepID=UPI00403477E8